MLGHSGASRLHLRPGVLDKMGSNVSGSVSERAEAAADRLRHRRAKWRARRYAGRILPHQAVARCGRYAKADEAGNYVEVRLGKHGADYRGLVTCGSVWHCPICAAKISAKRREEIGAILDGHAAEGGAVWMMTLTLPHHAFSKIADMRPAMSEAFRWMQQGREWKDAKAEIAFTGSVRALEVTHGGNGWHPHLHVLVLCNAPDKAVEAFGRMAFDRWTRALEKFGLGTPSPAAFDFSKARNVEDAGHYIAKGSVEHEMTSGHTKRAKGGNRSPWQILLDAEENGSDRDVALFQEYAAAFKGAKQLTWSKGLRDRYGVEETPDEIAAAQDANEAVTVLRISNQGWNDVIVAGGLQTMVLDAAEKFAPSELLWRLHSFGIPADILSPGDPSPSFEVVRL